MLNLVIVYIWSLKFEVKLVVRIKFKNCENVLRVLVVIIIYKYREFNFN